MSDFIFHVQGQFVTQYIGHDLEEAYKQSRSMSMSSIHIWAGGKELGFINEDYTHKDPAKFITTEEEVAYDPTIDIMMGWIDKENIKADDLLRLQMAQFKEGKNVTTE